MNNLAVKPPKTQVKTCPTCQGERYFYFGAPDAMGTEAVACERCNGKGKVAA